MDAIFLQIKDLIKQRTGLACDQSLSKVLQEEIQRRISETGVNSSAAYYHLLLINQEEFLKLINLLTVNETYFFREPGYITICINRLIPELVCARIPQKKLRLLSAGCSTGEEPYSLAIALHQKYGNGFQHLFEIIGFDIDRIAIQRAREGIFWKQSFRSIDSAVIDLYFEKIDSHRFRIKENVKTPVVFLNINLSDENLSDIIRDIDIIFYRNVSIYFDPATQKKIFTILSSLLNDNGYLIVSSTETLSHNYKILKLVEIDGLFLFQKSKDNSEKPAVRVKTPLPSNRKNLAPKVKELPYHPDHSTSKSVIKKDAEFPNQAEIRDINQLIEQATSLAIRKKYDESLQLITRVLMKNASSVTALLLRAYILFQQRHMEKAKLDCQRLIELDPLCMEGHFLLGLVEKYDNRFQDALNCFKKALYLCRENWLAHYYRAEIYQLLNDKSGSVREYQIILRLLEDGHFQDHGLSLVPISFSEHDIKHLCRFYLEKLSKETPETG